MVDITEARNIYTRRVTDAIHPLGTGAAELAEALAWALAEVDRLGVALARAEAAGMERAAAICDAQADTREAAADDMTRRGDHPNAIRYTNYAASARCCAAYIRDAYIRDAIRALTH